MFVEKVNFKNGRLTIPKSYLPVLDLRRTEHAIKAIKDMFQRRIAEALNLERVSAPLFVPEDSGLNDHLNGIEKPVRFNVKDMDEKAEIVQSLAKWKRNALADYGFRAGEGLYTDMNAIRPDEFLDNLHSIYVDQWDWEKVIRHEDRNLEFLKKAASLIYRQIYEMEREICDEYPQLPQAYLPENIFFIHAEELLDIYPELPPIGREDAICREKGAVFIIGIGAELKDGKPHDGRAADYDDWSTETGNGFRGLNGDILIWYPLLQRAFELSSMGIRVDAHALDKQLRIKNELCKKELYFHRRLFAGELPQSIGGGIGQSRLCMFFLRKAHIGEVQVGLWPEEMRTSCRKNGIPLL